MVHGVCSSAGCFSMTDEQVADIYAIARDSFAGGQREIQLQSYPFHMTAENMAKFRLDPNIDFWKNLKDGSDHFEVTKNEPSVLVCGKHYVFDATTKDEVTGSEPCPALKRDPNVEAQVAEKEDKDETKVAELVATGVKPIHLVYADGGQNPAFTGYKDVSDPDALASGPQEIVLNDRAKPVSAVVKVAAADADKKRAASVAAAPVEASAAEPAPTTVAAASAPASQSGGMLGGVTGGAKNVQKWLHLGGQEPAPASPQRRPIPINRFPRRRCRRTATTCIWRRCIRRRPRRRDGIPLTLRRTRPIRRPRRRRSSSSDGVSRRGPVAALSRSEPRGGKGGAPPPQRQPSLEFGTTIGHAISRPYVNKAAGVFRLFAIGVAQSSMCARPHPTTAFHRRTSPSPRPPIEGARSRPALRCARCESANDWPVAGS